jgi:hypothetical protein
MTKEEHRKRHQELHRSFDELLADFLRHNRDRGLADTNLIQFMEWSCTQIRDPTEDPEHPDVEGVVV